MQHPARTILPISLALLAWIAPSPAAAGDDCTVAARYIYVVTADRELHRFHPQQGTFEKVGALACEARTYARPYSMAVGRDGTAWMVMDDGNLFTVSTQTARCTAVPGFRTGQSGFTAFGMGFQRDPDTQTDHLYVSTASRIGGQGYKLGELDTRSLLIREVGIYDRLSARAELSGTGDGRLFGAFEGAPFTIAEINPQNARIRSTIPLSQVNAAANTANFAFAFWGGDFYLFAGPGATTEVYRYDPEEDAAERLTHSRLTIVGAGVSTCAPVEFPTEDFTQSSTPTPAPTPAPSPASTPTTDAGGGLVAEIAAISPGPHPPGEDLTVVAGVRDDQGRWVPLDGGTFHISDPAGHTTDVPGTVRPDGQVEAHIPLNDVGDVRIGFTPQPASRARPTASPAVVSVGWGLRFELQGLPTTCVTQQPCAGTVVLQQQGDGARRLLADPQTRLVHEEDGAPVRADPVTVPLAPFPVERTYQTPGTVRWRMRLRSPLGEIESAEHTVTIREPFVLRAPAALDLGARTAGDPTATRCQALDLSASSGRAGQQLVLHAEGLEGCLSAPRLRVNGEGPRSLPLTVDAEAALEVCLEVPFCAPDVAPDGARLVLTPQDPAAADSPGVEVALRWTVAGRSWLACNGLWLWPTLAGLATLVVVVGLVRPRRFPTGASVRLAGSVKGLKRASATVLRGCPGAAPGFYRDARLGIHGDGSVNSRLRGAVALLRATRQGVRLEPRGPLEVYDRRRQSWHPPEAPEGGRLIEPSPSETYRIGELYFQIEPG